MHTEYFRVMNQRGKIRFIKFYVYFRYFHMIFFIFAVQIRKMSVIFKYKKSMVTKIM